MVLSEKRKLMDEKLRTIVVPTLREMGFSGSYPNFRKESNGHYQFVSFQTNREGGSFVIEVAKTSRDKLPTIWKDTPFTELDYGHTKATDRARIVSEQNQDGPWFSYVDFSNTSEFENLARSILPLLGQLKSFFLS